MSAPAKSNPSSNTDAPLIRRDTDGIAYLTLNRGRKFNALSHGLLDALQTTLEAIADDTSVRVVVLAAAGKAFCAGHDLKEMRQDPSLDANQALFDKCSKMMLTISALPQPVIAKVHGIATAAGCQLVAQCDLAVASQTATFATSGINVGLFCSTPMVAVSRNMHRKHAMEMLLTGDFVDAARAIEIGLINSAVPADRLDRAVDELAAKIAAKSPTSIAMGKQLFYRQLEAAQKVAYDMAAQTMACNMMADDAQNGVDAFVAKQPMPEWKDR